MWPFKRQPEGPPILRVLLGDEEVCVVHASEVPKEKQIILELKDPQLPLRFIDSKGGARSYDLSSAIAEGPFFHMSIRVGPTFAVMPDGILAKTRNEDAGAAFRGGAKGIRFQGFLLPESSGNNRDYVGLGLFMRGIHFSGHVTPGNVSLLCMCDSCSRSFRLQSFHAGFSNLVYFYCSAGPHTLTASSYEPDAPPVMGKADPAATARFESQLPACEACGGNFRYLNPLLCPHCKQPYIDFARFPEERKKEYYGNVVYGATTQYFESTAFKTGKPA